MELEAGVLTFIVVMALALWQGCNVRSDQESQGSQQIHKAVAAHGRANDGGGVVRAAYAGDDPAFADAGAPPAVASRLAAIAFADSSFDPDRFLRSACIVYETVVAAYANGDRELLRELLSADVYEAFSDVIEAREIRGEHTEQSFVRLKRAAIVDACVSNEQVQVAIDVESEIVTATRDFAGAVVAGDPARVVTVSDHWTFAKNRTFRGAAWKLVATEPLQSETRPSEIVGGPPQNPAAAAGKQPARLNAATQ